MFDSHAHYDDKAFDEDRDKAIKQVRQEGVECIINAGSSIKSSHRSIQLAERYDFIYAAIGVHPHDAKEAPENYIDLLKEMAKNKNVVAIGEIGLDYYYDNSPRELQKRFLIEQIRLAKELKLPIIIHDRDAHEDTMKILREEKVSEIGGVMHCFSGSFEMAKEVIKLGLHIGVGGSLTFKNARKTVEVVEKIPSEYILSETDCPYLTPVPHRGKRNDSRYMRFVIEKISEIKGISFEEISRKLSENAKSLFKTI